MPILQVRDMDDRLYDRLKFAANNTKHFENIPVLKLENRKTASRSL